MWKTLPPRWRFRAPQTQFSGAVPCRRIVTPPTWPTAVVRRPTVAVHRGLHNTRPSQGFPRTLRVLRSSLPGAMPGAHTRARQPQPHKDPCPRGPGWVCLWTTGPVSYARLEPRQACPARTSPPSGARVNAGTRGLRVQGVAPPWTWGATPLYGSPDVSRTRSVTWRTPRPRVRPCPPSRIAACRSYRGSERLCTASRGIWPPCGVTTPRSAGNWCGSGPARGPSKRWAAASANSSPTPAGGTRCCGNG